MDIWGSNADIISDKAERLLAEAASYGSQLVVFPEAFVGGYPRGSNFGAIIGNRTPKGKEEFRKYHAAAINVPGKSPFVLELLKMNVVYKMTMSFFNSLHCVIETNSL